MGQTDDGRLPTISDSGSGGATSLPGELPQIEGYQITAMLGEGGMGTVWRAVQLSTRREVALKLLPGRLFASDKARTRFEREVELTARLEHPNIARVYDSGLQRGVYCYAMELIDGLPLDQYVQQSKLTQRRILEMMKTIAQAVQHAHQRGVIHRDLKPSNILVTEDGQPHVLDFGLAKAVFKEEPGLTVSQHGDVAGTAAYMSPEQAAGRVEHIDTRSDVYSLGVILYRLLTGRFPHDLSGTRYELLRRIAEKEVRIPRELSRSIDKDIQALVLTALALEPSSRYTSSGELAEDLGRYLKGDLVRARKPTVPYIVWRFVRTYRIPIEVVVASFVMWVILRLRYKYLLDWPAGVLIILLGLLFAAVGLGVLPSKKDPKENKAWVKKYGIVHLLLGVILLMWGILRIIWRIQF